jgi:hypothetical protein
MHVSEGDALVYRWCFAMDWWLTVLCSDVLRYFVLLRKPLLRTRASHTETQRYVDAQTSLVGVTRYRGTNIAKTHSLQHTR